MSCHPVMTMLVGEHLRQHQRASNYDPTPAAEGVKDVVPLKQTRLSAELPTAEVTAARVYGASASGSLYHPRKQLAGHCVSIHAELRN